MQDWSLGTSTIYYLVSSHLSLNSSQKAELPQFACIENPLQARDISELFKYIYFIKQFQQIYHVDIINIFNLR